MNTRIRLTGKHLPVSDYGDDYLWLDSLTGTDYLNQLFSYSLIVKTKDTNGNPAHSISGLEGFTPRDQTEAGASPAHHLDIQSLIGTKMGV